MKTYAITYSTIKEFLVSTSDVRLVNFLYVKAENEEQAIEKAKEEITNLVDGREFADSEEKYLYVWYDTCDNVLVDVRDLGC